MQFIDPIRDRLEAYTHSEDKQIDIKRCEDDLLYFTENFIKNQKSLSHDFQKVLMDNLDKLYEK